MKYQMFFNIGVLKSFTLFTENTIFNFISFNSFFYL